MGGSSGALLQTFNGNIVANEINGVTPGKIVGYWSGSRPIIDQNQVNYFDSDKLSASGLPSGIVAAFVGKSAADFTQKETFEALGWDFANVWDWNATNNVPVPKVIDVGGEEDNLVTIITSAGPGGKISPEGNVLVERGQNQKFTFTPNNYYEIDAVKIDGVENSEAAAAGEYIFENVTSVHNIDVTFKLSDATSGVAPSLVSTSAYYNRAVEKHIEVTVDFGEGALGIQPENYRKAVKSVKIMKDNELVLDAQGGYWFPSTGYGKPEELLEICWDDIIKLPGYDNLVVGTYDLVIIFDDLSSSEYTIPLTVEDGFDSSLTVDGGTFTVDGNAVNSPAEIKEGSEVTIEATVPVGQRFVKWTVTGLENESYTTNPLTFAMPANKVTLKAEYENIPSGDPKGNIISVISEVKQSAEGILAFATVTEKAIADAMAATSDDMAATIGVKVDAPEDVKKVELTIPTASIGAIAEGKIESMSIATPIASMVFNDKALKTIVREAETDVKISASVVDKGTLSGPKGILKKVEDRPVYDFSITSGNQEISNFHGGKATVEVPYILKAGEKANSIAVYYLDHNGNLNHVRGKFDSTTGTVKMTLSHF